MALLFLRLSSCPHSHLSIPFPRSHSPIKPSRLFSFSLSPSIKISNHHSSNQHFTSLIAQTSSSATVTTTTEEEDEDVKESVVIPDRRRLIAQNIPWTCTAADIRALFDSHGTVVDVELSMHNSSRNRGLAFITMASEEEATVALNNLNSYDLDGRIIKVDFSRSLKKNPPAETQVPTKKYNVYVGNLAWRVKSQDLRELFNDSGEVLSAEIVFQSKPRRPAGYGFVSFSSREEAEAAISTLNGKIFLGRPLRLGFSKLQTDDVEAVSYEVEESGEAFSEVNTNAQLSNQDDEI